jgi:molybdate transport system substrate-binding protein
MCTFMLTTIFVAPLWLALLAGHAAAAEIRVFSGGGPREALRHLAPEFERASGHHVEFTYQLVTEIQRKLEAGEKADVILLPVPLIAATEKTVPLRAEGRVVLARVGIAVIVRQGAPPPDISTAEAVRKTLVDARAIAWSDASTPAGGHLDRAARYRRRGAAKTHYQGRHRRRGGAGRERRGGLRLLSRQ